MENPFRYYKSLLVELGLPSAQERNDFVEFSNSGGPLKNICRIFV